MRSSSYRSPLTRTDGGVSFSENAGGMRRSWFLTRAPRRRVRSRCGPAESGHSSYPSSRDPDHRVRPPFPLPSSPLMPPPLSSYPSRVAPGLVSLCLSIRCTLESSHSPTSPPCISSPSVVLSLPFLICRIPPSSFPLFLNHLGNHQAVASCLQCKIIHIIHPSSHRERLGTKTGTRSARCPRIAASNSSKEASWDAIRVPGLRRETWQERRGTNECELTIYLESHQIYVDDGPDRWKVHTGQPEPMIQIAK